MAKSVRQVPYYVPPNVVTLISSGSIDGESNIITVSLTTLTNIDTVGICIVPDHYSCGLIKRSQEFVLNYPTADILDKVDFIGNCSGADTDKFAATGLTKVAGTAVSAPLIGECPVSLECAVVEHMSLGMMEFFVGQVKAYHVEEGYMDDMGRIDFAGKGFLAYGGMLGAGAYMPLGQLLGYSGLSKKDASAE